MQRPDDNGIEPLYKRKHLVRMLRRAGIAVSESTVRRYQALSLIPKARARGRPGQGRGVDWGWTDEDAKEVVRRVRFLKRHQKGARGLVALMTANPDLSDLINELTEDVRNTAYQAGYEDGFAEAKREMGDASLDAVREREAEEPMWDPMMSDRAEES